MAKKKLYNKKIRKKIALKRINQLFMLAEQNALSGRLSRSNRYVKLARKIAMRYLVPIPKEFKRTFCSHCYSYLLPTRNCRIRVHRSKLIVYCYECKKYMRIPLK